MSRFRVRLWPLVSLAALVGIALASCSPLLVLNGLVPENGFRAKQDIGYGSLPRQRLDVYSPRRSGASHPVVVFFYGGAWQSGERGDYLFVAEALTSRGYVVVIPDYRLYPDVVFPAFEEDAALALRWSAEHISRYGGDPERLFVMGHSAGAQIAALLAYDGGYLSRVGIGKRRIKGMISLAGPMDFLPITEQPLERVFPLASRDASQPINFVSASQAPSLLLHGEADTRVLIRNSRNLAARIAERGGSVETTYYPEMGHIDIILALSAPFRDGKPVLDRIARFIDSH